MLLLCPFYRWGNWSSERLTNLLKTIGSISSRACWTPGPIFYLTMLSCLLQQPSEVDLLTQMSTPSWFTASSCINNQHLFRLPKQNPLAQSRSEQRRLHWKFLWELQEVVYFIHTMANILDISILYFIRYFCSLFKSLLAIPPLGRACVVFYHAAPIFFAFFLFILTLSHQFQIAYSFMERSSALFQILALNLHKPTPTPTKQRAF